MATKQATTSSPTADEAARVAEFRVALRRFQRQTEVVARDCGITPAWYLLLPQIKGSPDLTGQTTVTFARAFGSLASEREALRAAIAHLDD